MYDLDFVTKDKHHHIICQDQQLRLNFDCFQNSESGDFAILTNPIL